MKHDKQEVLFIGGPLDGKVEMINPNLTYYSIPVPGKAQFYSETEPMELTPMGKVIYKLRKWSCGHVMVLNDMTDAQALQLLIDCYSNYVRP